MHELEFNTEMKFKYKQLGEVCDNYLFIGFENWEGRIYIRGLSGFEYQHNDEAEI